MISNLFLASMTDSFYIHINCAVDIVLLISAAFECDFQFVFGICARSIELRKLFNENVFYFM